MEEQIALTRDTITKIFTEWWKEYETKPEEFDLSDKPVVIEKQVNYFIDLAKKFMGE